MTNNAADILMGGRCYLRPLTDADVTADYIGWLNDPAVTRYMETGREPSTAASVRRYLERFRAGQDRIFAIIDRATERHIGNVTLNRVHPVHRTADTGLMIGRAEFWGRGYATEAWALALDYAFHRAGLRKIIAGAAEGHAASQAVLRRLGFREEGRLRAEALVDGAYQDCVRFGLLEEEFTMCRCGRVAAGRA